MSHYTDTRRPVLVTKYEGYYHAWNEHCNLVAMTKSWESLQRLLATQDYSQVSPNSRIAATIRDKFRQKGYRV